MTCGLYFVASIALIYFVNVSFICVLLAITATQKNASYHYKMDAWSKDVANIIASQLVIQ